MKIFVQIFMRHIQNGYCKLLKTKDNLALLQQNQQLHITVDNLKSVSQLNFGKVTITLKEKSYLLLFQRWFRPPSARIWLIRALNTWQH